MSAVSSGPPRGMCPALAIASLDESVFGRAPCPVYCGHGGVIGAGMVLPEIKFTLPPIAVTAATWPAVGAGSAIAGVPIAMEGRDAGCAHLSHVGNVAVADAWSNGRASGWPWPMTRQS